MYVGIESALKKGTPGTDRGRKENQNAKEITTLRAPKELDRG
jgi:hypothetical protein